VRLHYILQRNTGILISLLSCSNLVPTQKSSTSQDSVQRISLWKKDIRKSPKYSRINHFAKFRHQSDNEDTVSYRSTCSSIAISPDLGPRFRHASQILQTVL